MRGSIAEPSEGLGAGAVSATALDDLLMSNSSANGGALG